MSLSSRLAALVALAVTGAALVVTPTAATAAAPAAAAAPTAAEPRTWNIDAADLPTQAWWVRETNQNNLDHPLTITEGDTVLWHFDDATQYHDLLSQDTLAPWMPPLTNGGDPGDPAISYTFDTPGTYHYICNNHQPLMSGSIIVRPAGSEGENQPPTAAPMASPQSGAAPLLVSFMAHGGDADGDPLTYLWDFGTDPGTSDQSGEENPQFTYTAPGTYTATLTVSDGRGGEAVETLPITVSGGTAGPQASAAADMTSGVAPLAVQFSGYALDAGGQPLDDATYAWDFGLPGDGDTSTAQNPAFNYTDPGVYTATLTVTDTGGRQATDSIDVTVTGEGALPEVEASATPTSGAAPLTVDFDAQVTTTGTFHPFAAGLTTYPDLTGTAELVRTRGQTHASLDVTGLKPEARHDVHVHEQACTDGNAGAHFRFDTTKPFGASNEIWLPFTSTTTGASGPVAVSQPQRAGAKAVSIVIHDPDTPSLRIGCVDLGPTTDGLTYTWNFGDGTTNTGPNPTHTYTTAGTYTAVVTVASGTENVTSSVKVVVRDVVAPDTSITSGPSGTVRAKRAVFRLASTESGGGFECRLDQAGWRSCGARAVFAGLGEGKHTLRVRALDAAGNRDASPALRTWTVDRTAPRITGTKPTGTVRDRTPTIRATVRDRFTAARSIDVVLRVDGLKAPATVKAGGKVAWTPKRALAPGRHVVRLVAADAAGNRTTRTWRFTIRR
ncbi:PKD domain-containing protein [Nocardioides sp. GXZ039]|uniref:PKD domain-containing protein n=1 Tax=Nocardioides sp. GXZ039 TaxID=3136018 RepID=UPI0030F49227